MRQTQPESLCRVQGKLLLKFFVNFSQISVDLVRNFPYECSVSLSEVVIVLQLNLICFVYVFDSELFSCLLQVLFLGIFDSLVCAEDASRCKFIFLFLFRFGDVCQLLGLLQLNRPCKLICLSETRQLVLVKFRGNFSKNFDVLNQKVAVVLGLNILHKVVVAVLDNFDERVYKHLDLDSLALLHHATH